LLSSFVASDHRASHAGAGGARNRAISVQDFLEHLPRQRDPGHLEHDVPAAAHNLLADLDQLLAQAGQRLLFLEGR